jgi:hypothetical protein
VLYNCKFVEGDLKNVDYQSNSYVISVHACNEANAAVLELADKHSAGWAVMPCCIRDGLYVTKFSAVEDTSRHALACGIIAGNNKAQKVVSIDSTITNRNVLIMGAYDSQ